MALKDILFFTFAFVAAISALAILFSKNIFKAVLALLMCLLSIAGVYVFLNAEFVAATQILIYAGGVVVLILFVIMLSNKLNTKAARIENHNILSGLIAMSSFLGILTSTVALHWPATETGHSKTVAVEHAGENLVSSYAFPFEVAGILLLVTLIGASLIAFDKKNTNG